jgi:hypothetical protein
MNAYWGNEQKVYELKILHFMAKNFPHYCSTKYFNIL